MDDNIDFLGKGWSFPISFDKTLSKVNTSTVNKDILESLEILLSTTPGERHLHPEFGCDLSALSFEPLTSSLKVRIKEIINTVVLLYEPRILIEDIKFEDRSKEGIVFIHIFYRIKSTNSRTNLVYPYYLIEATDANI